MAMLERMRSQALMNLCTSSERFMVLRDKMCYRQHIRTD